MFCCKEFVQEELTSRNDLPCSLLLVMGFFQFSKYCSARLVFVSFLFTARCC